MVTIPVSRFLLEKVNKRGALVRAKKFENFSQKNKRKGGTYSGPKSMLFVNQIE